MISNLLLIVCVVSGAFMCSSCASSQSKRDMSTKESQKSAIKPSSDQAKTIAMYESLYGGKRPDPWDWKFSDETWTTFSFSVNAGHSQPFPEGYAEADRVLYQFVQSYETASASLEKHDRDMAARCEGYAKRQVEELAKETVVIDEMRITPKRCGAQVVEKARISPDIASAKGLMLKISLMMALNTPEHQEVIRKMPSPPIADEGKPTLAISPRMGTSFELVVELENQSQTKIKEVKLTKFFTYEDVDVKGQKVERSGTVRTFQVIDEFQNKYQIKGRPQDDLRLRPGDKGTIVVHLEEPIPAARTLRLIGLFGAALESHIVRPNSEEVQARERYAVPLHSPSAIESANGATSR